MQHSLFPELVQPKQKKQTKSKTKKRRRRRRPNSPRQRKNESWPDFSKRWNEWIDLYGNKISPEWGKRWAKVRERVFTSAKRHAEQSKRNIEEQGLIQPFPNNPFVSCNQTALDLLEQAKRHGGIHKIPQPACQTCRYTPNNKATVDCFYPTNSRIKTIGSVEATLYQRIGFFDWPQLERNISCCCMRGAVRLARLLKADGYRDIHVSQSIKQRQVVAKQVKACWED